MQQPLQLAEPFDDEDDAGEGNEQQQQQQDEEKKIDPDLFTADLFCACKTNDSGTILATCRWCRFLTRPQTKRRNCWISGFHLLILKAHGRACTGANRHHPGPL